MNFNPYVFFVELSPSRIEERSHIFSNEEQYGLFCLGFIGCVFDFTFRAKNGHRVLVVINVCYLILIIVYSRSPNSKFHRPTKVVLFDSFSGLFSNTYVFVNFLSGFHLVANYVKNVDELGRNIICVCTLPDLLVKF